MRGPAGPWWHTLLFEGQVDVDVRAVCLQDVKKMFASETSQDALLEEMGRPNTSAKIY